MPKTRLRSSAKPSCGIGPEQNSPYVLQRSFRAAVFLLQPIVFSDYLLTGNHSRTSHHPVRYIVKRFISLELEEHPWQTPHS